MLRRCIVEKVMTSMKETPTLNYIMTSIKETPTLNDIGRWACNTWKSTISVNVHEINDSQFLFELPSRKDAEHVLMGEWRWKKSKVILDWWKPTTRCWSGEMERDWVWIRL